MAHLAESRFSLYDLTQEEEVEGRKLTITQTQCIHNERTLVAEQIINLEKRDGMTELEYFAKKAKLQGQLDAYTYLLNMSDATVQAEKELAITTMQETTDSET